MTQYYSRVDATLNGDVYNIPFSYAKESEISVYINDEIHTDWIFLNESQVKLTTIPSDLPTDTVVSIRRTTDITKKVVDYTNQSMLIKEDLNKSQDQLLNSVQEIYDNNVQFEIDIDNKLVEVNEAARLIKDTLETVDQAVETSEQQAQIATEQATIATEKADEVKEVYEQAITDISNVSSTEKAELENIKDEAVEVRDELVQGNMYKYNLFDLIEKDHILTYEESKGLALLGTYVYKEAVAGSRYGYPDFYNKVVEEYGNATEEVIINRRWTQPVLTENGTLGGNTFAVSSNVEQYSDNAVYYLFDGSTDNNFHSVSGTTTGYIDFYNPVPLRITNLQITNQSTANRASTAGVIYGSNDGADWEEITTYTNTTTASSGVWNIDLSTNENYYKYYRLESTAGGTQSYWTIAEITITAIEYLVTVKRNANRHYFYDIAEKANIDNIYDIYGIAWYYGVDTENERVFLPRNDYFFKNGTSDNVGLKVDPELPNIYGETNLAKTHGLINSTAKQTGPFKIGSTKYASANATTGESGANYGLIFDASSASEIYKDGGTVVADGVNVLVYMCVGNTTSTSTITDVVDVTTTENDTTPLFTGMYFDFTPNNVSWVKGNGQVKNEGIYKFTYNKLVNELTTPKYNLKVIETANMVDGVDYSEYWKVDQDAMTFTTPTAISNKALSGAVVGNGKTLGLTDGTDNYGLISRIENIPPASWTHLDGYAEDYGTEVSVGGSTISSDRIANLSRIGITTDPDNSGIIAEQSTAQLYFKVANAVQNLEMLNAGYILENMVDKANMVETSVCIEEYVNGTSGYRIYSDMGNGRYCVQWGTVASGNTEDIITLLIPYKDDNYRVIPTLLYESSNAAHCPLIGTKSTTGFTIFSNSTGATAAGKDWFTKGYLA